MVIFTKKFGTLDPHLPIVWDKVPKKTFFFTPSLIHVNNFIFYKNSTHPYLEKRSCQLICKLLFECISSPYYSSGTSWLSNDEMYELIL